MTEQLDGLSAQEKRRLLAQMLAEKAAQPQVVPASFAQHRFWFLSRFAPDLPVYNLPTVYRLCGKVDAAALERSLQRLVQRHETLRTTFAAQDEEPVQMIAPQMAARLETVDLRPRPGVAETRIDELVKAPFDLETGPLLRASLLQVAEEDYFLVVVLHHIVADGWSMGVLFQELWELYEGEVAARPGSLPPLPLQYADYSRRQRERMESGRLRQQLAYWREQLGDATYSLNLPTDFPRPQVDTHAGARQQMQLPAALTADLVALSKQERVTLFMALLSAFAVLLHRYAGQDDLLVGTPIAGRREEDVEGLIGLFLNTLVLRTTFADNPTFRQVLQQVRKTALAAYENQDIPFEAVIDELNPERDTSRPPIFQVMFGLQNMPDGSVDLPDLTAEQVDAHTETTKLDLTLYLFEHPDGLRGTWEYNTALFAPETIARMQCHFVVILERMVADPGRAVGDFALLTDAERRQRRQWNQTDADFPDQTIHAAFAAQAQRTPDAVAVRGIDPAGTLTGVAGEDEALTGAAGEDETLTGATGEDEALTGATGEDEALTYAQLNRRANRLAHHLHHLGVAPGSVVGVCLPRTPATVVALLAVMKAGGVYLPLDPTYPPGRVAFMLDDSGADITITDTATAEMLPAGTTTVAVDDDWLRIAGQPATALDVSVAATDAAYLMYTSGSTGRPKGVLGTHRGALNRFAWMWHRYPFAAGEVCCQKTSLSFVDSVWEIFGPLLQGVPSVLIPDDVQKDPRRLVRVLAGHQVSRIVLVPSLLWAILATHENLAAQLPHLALWVTSGEALSVQLAAAFREKMPGARLLNLYGSSEVAADATCYDLQTEGWSPETEDEVPIGKPITNTTIRILDRYRQPVPVGVPGEIYVGGVGLALGYAHRPGLTAARFVPDPHQPGATLYKTGDLGAYRPDGHIRFLGRRDYQVKIRGFRVELGEIEAALRRHPAVEEAVVVVRAAQAGTKRLFAYATVTEETSWADLRRFLGARLPDYMLPAGVVFLDHFPLTPSGKINRLALPDPDTARPDVGTDYVAPATLAEELVARLWQDLLDVDRVGRHDNFFALGGHSLLAVQLTFRLQERFRVELPLRDLFARPTVAGIVGQLGRIWGDDAVVEEIARTWQELEEEEAAGR